MAATATTRTLADVIGLAEGADEVLEYLDRQVSVPVLGAPQAQGDVIVVPVLGDPALGYIGEGHPSSVRPVPAGGVPVVRGENGGHTHHLIADGDVAWRGGAEGRQELGRLVVHSGAAYLLHPEHGATGVAPGDYVIRRQREFRPEADVLVAD